MSKTEDNLKAAFAGESQANRKYLAFAKKADEEGYSQVARLFRAAAHAETVHAHNHLNALKGVGSTLDNLKAAIEGETYEFTDMYPGFIDEAEEEEELKAKRSFELANTVEKTHEELYKKALSSIEDGNDQESTDIFVCEVCGHTHEGDDAPDSCPVCGSPQSKFTKIE